MNSNFFLTVVACFATTAFSSSISLEMVGEYSLPPNTPEGLSGLTWLGEDRWAFAEDSGGRIHIASLAFSDAGELTNTTWQATYAGLGKDLEGIAYDPSTDTLWASDEVGPVVVSAECGERRAEKGKSSSALCSPLSALTEPFASARPNLSLESLTFGAGRLWTANEESLVGDPTGLVRIASIRCDVASASEPSVSMYCVQLEPPRGSGFGSLLPVARNGLSDMAALPDGRLLLLERNAGSQTDPAPRGSPKELPPPGVSHAFETAIFLVDPATSTSPEQPLAKTELFRMRTRNANYEGMALGPQLPDGSQLLLLVSDGDSVHLGRVTIPFPKKIMALRLAVRGNAAGPNP